MKTTRNENATATSRRHVGLSPDPDVALTIGVSTLSERSHAIELPHRRPDVEILVVVQQGPASPHLSNDRNDIRVLLDDGVGVARSRNLVIENARGRYILFADDDSAHLQSGLESVLAKLEASPGLSIVQGRAVDSSGRPRKRYPRRYTALHHWNTAKIGTIELIVRRDDIIRSKVRFDERFGAGSTFHLGDEFIFVTDALKLGLRGVFMPIDVATHPFASSGVAQPSRREAHARAAVFERVFGPRAFVARIGFFLRRPLRFGSTRLALRFLAGTRAFR